MSLIKRILDRIKEYLKTIFHSNKTKLIEEKSNVFDINDLEDNVDINSLETEGTIKESLDDEFEYEDHEKERKDFLRVYENVKNGIIDPNDLLITDLIKVQMMMEKELELLDEKISLTEGKIRSSDNQIKELEEESKRLASLIN